MRISAKADYAVRAATELAAAKDGPTKGDAIARAQDIPLRFLENILGDMRQAGLVRSQRGAEGGYWLAKPAKEITVADIIRAVEGPLAAVRGEAPEDIVFSGSAESLGRLWIAVRASLRGVLENVTLADLVDGKLPARVDYTWIVTAGSPSTCVTRWMSAGSKLNDSPARTTRELGGPPTTSRSSWTAPLTTIT
jgi:Rrf2 family protein